MKTRNLPVVLLLSISAAVAACSGGSGEDIDGDPTGMPDTPGAENESPGVSFVQPADGDTLDEGGTAHAVVEASDTDGTITSVSLAINGSLVRDDDAAPFEWGEPGSSEDAALRNLSPGDYTLTATATDDGGAQSSATITVSVVAANPGGRNAPPTVTFAEPADGSVFEDGHSAYVVVDAADSDGTIDNVQLFLNGAFVRQENVSPYEWGAPGGTNDAALRNLAPGDYELSAVATDDAGATATAQIAFAVDPPPAAGTGSCRVSGDMRRWHRVTVACRGFAADESNDSTFTDYRFDVTFSNAGSTIRVPGHFAADGQAADTSADAGDTWRAHFSPPSTGEWQYAVSFRTGPNVAVDPATNAGTAMNVLNGLTGSFTVSEAPAASRDMRTRGLLEHLDGERYLRFAGSGSVYIEGGMDSPENIFGYSEFDNTTKFSDANSCKGILHDFAPHAGDWNTGDPVWGQGRGKSLIGLVNYIASTGVNAIYIMANTVRGDGCDAHPWTEYNADGSVKRFDVSKLDQWERVLSHMTSKGIMIHVVTQETENDQLLNGGDLGLERKLYYRELISRFGHHPALQWNLGEENTNTADQQRNYADYIRALDPYDHPIVMHTYPNSKDRYTALLGHPSFDGPTMQFGGIPNDATGSSGVYGTAVDWITRSTDAGKPWVVTFTEASGGDAPTPNTDVTKLQRVYWMWASAMSGGGGFEWYLKNPGAGHAYDLAVEDLREFDAHWQQSGHFVRFWRDIVQGEAGADLQMLERDNAVTSATSDWVLADPGSTYVIFLREGGGTDIDLPNAETYDVLWFDPRTGREVSGGTLQGPGLQFTGSPPTDPSADWAVVVSSRADTTTGGSDAKYQQADGLVVMEAENTETANLGLWLEKTEVDGYSGSSYIEFDGNSALNGPPTSPLTYTFSISQSGLHYLHLHVARETRTINGETRTDVANDAYVRLDGDFGAGPNAGNNHGDDAPLSTLQSNTKFFGGNDRQFVWASGNRLDLGGHNNKRVAVYDLKAGETYTFTMSGRSRYFKVDRIVFRHESVSRADAEDLSRAETR